jgi:hypothetical protein
MIQYRIETKTEVQMGSRATPGTQQFLLLIVILLAGCSAPQTPAPTATETRQFVLSHQPNVPTVAGTSQVLLYAEEPPEGFPNDAAHIVDVALEKDILNIDIIYQGGCKEHIFQLYAWTAFLQSLPPQGVFYLSHDAQGDACIKKMDKLLSFNLAPLNTERNDPSEHPLLLRILEPVGGSFTMEPYMPLIEWP